MADILVFGSLNVDFVVTTGTLPGPGETVPGYSFRVHPGGKGANQAVAAARAGGSVSMAGRTGRDSFSEILNRSLSDSGAAHDLVIATPDTPTGCAFIAVDRLGENSIIVVPGANGLVEPSDAEAALAAMPSIKTLLLQLEVPLPSVVRAIEVAHERGVSVMLDPAPAPSRGELPSSVLKLIDVIMPNQHEAAALTGRDVTDVESAITATDYLLKAGVKRAIVKLGELGVVAGEGDRIHHVPGFKVKAVDTTAAGDTFAGDLAVALGEGQSLEKACVFANAAGAISVTRVGAQPSMPCRFEIEALLRQTGRMNDE